MTQLSRRVLLQIKYDKTDISEDIAPFVCSMSYTDNSSGKADDLQLELEDRGNLWTGDWFPEKGATVTASIITQNWNASGEEQTLPCGLFEIDEIDCNGPPEKVTIKAVSVPITSSLRGQDKTRAWEETNLSVIANDICSGAELTLLFDTDDDPYYERIEQTEQSDLSFLRKICEENGLSLKVTDSQIVIFDDAKYEQIDPVATIERGGKNVLKYSGTSKSSDVYSSCQVIYHDSHGKVKFDYTYTIKNPPATGKKLVINERVTSLAEAMRKAKKKLREKNKDEVKFSLVLVGNVELVGGVTVLIKGWGTFDGKYFVEKASHDMGNGFTTKIDLRRVLEGY